MLASHPQVLGSADLKRDVGICVYMCVFMYVHVCVFLKCIPGWELLNSSTTCFKDEMTKVQREFICLKLSKLMKWRKWSWPILDLLAFGLVLLRTLAFSLCKKKFLAFICIRESMLHCYGSASPIESRLQIESPKLSRVNSPYQGPRL